MRGEGCESGGDGCEGGGEGCESGGEGVRATPCDHYQKY